MLRATDVRQRVCRAAHIVLDLRDRNVMNVAHYAKCVQNPDDNSDDNNHINELFDLGVDHCHIRVEGPKKDTNDDECDN